MATCRRLLLQSHPDESFEDLHYTYSLLGHIMYAIYLSFEEDLTDLVDMATRALDLSTSDPNSLAYIHNDTRLGHYTCYEFALFLSHRLYPGEALDGLLSAFQSRGGRVRARVFEGWGVDLQRHATSRGAVVGAFDAYFDDPSPAAAAAAAARLSDGYAREKVDSALPHGSTG